MDRADHPSQLRLQPFLDNAESLVAASRVGGPWALRLDVGRPATRRLLDGADLDNYAFPLARRLDDPELVSVWCTKQHTARSYVRVEPADEGAPPSTGVFVTRTTGVSYAKIAYKEQIRSAVVTAAELPATRAVKLNLAFVIGSGTNTKWWNLWKPTIDALDPLLGRDPKRRDWHPLDGRITELGMHLSVDPTLRYEVVVGIHAELA